MISVIFQCHDRLPLVQICLERFLHMIEGWDYELIMLWDRHNKEFFHTVNEIANPHWWIIDREEPTRGLRGKGLNRAFDIASGDYYLFLEDDWYWHTPCLNDAIVALEHVDFIRLCRKPFQATEYDYGWWYEHKPDTGYAWNFNPQLTKEKFLAGRFPEDKWSIEGEYHDRFRTTGRRAGFSKEDHFAHIGIINARGIYRLNHLYRMDGLEPLDYFKSLSPSQRHLDLYKEYLTLEVERI